MSYIDSNEKTRKVDSWVKIEERSYVPFYMLMRHRVRNLGSTISAIIYINVFLKAGFGAVTFTKEVFGCRYCIATYSQVRWPVFFSNGYNIAVADQI